MGTGMGRMQDYDMDNTELEHVQVLLKAILHTPPWQQLELQKQKAPKHNKETEAIGHSGYR